MVQRLTSLVKDLENVESVCKDQIEELAKSERPLNLQKSRPHVPEEYEKDPDYHFGSPILKR